MDAQAIDKIQALVQASQIGHPGTDVPTMLVPEGYRLASLEQYQEAPSRYRGVYSTRSIDDFAEYVNTQEIAEVFVDTDDMDALAFFDLGNPVSPGHAEHRASLALQKTAPYRAVLSAHESAFGQKELAHWIEDWHAHIEGESTNGNMLSPKQLANMVRRIEIKATSERSHEDGDWNAKRTGLDAIDASTGTDTPAVIRLTCLPYEGLPLRTFDLRVSILTDIDKPKIKLRVMGLEGIQEEIARDFKDVLRANLDDDATLLLGNFKKG